MRSLLLHTLAWALLVSAETQFPAHKIAGNLFYVGSVEYAAYLVATPQGHILINSSFEESVPLIEQSVAKQGFRFKDVKILLTSHAHADHIAGCAAVKQSTGAKVMIMRGDEDIVASGGQGDFQYEDSRFKPCAVDRVLEDGDTVTLGGATLTAVLTAGHTRGCTTWTMTATEDGKKLLAVIIGSPNVNPGYKLVGNDKYRAIAGDFQKTFHKLKSLRADLFLGAHGQYYGLEEKYPRLGGGPNPFVDPAGYQAYVSAKEKEFLGKLEAQKQGQ